MSNPPVTLTPWKDYAQVPPGESPKSAGLVKLLERLQKEDTWFDYNVPPNIRDSYPEAQLLDHLDRTYAQERFVISDPLEVGKYIQPGERVVAKETLKSIKWWLKAGAQGYVRKAAEKPGNKPTVSFMLGEHFYLRKYWDSETPPLIPIALEELLVVGREGFFSDKMFEKERRASLMVSSREKVEVGHVVEYTGDPLEKCLVKVPEGAERLVVSVYSRGIGKVAESADVCWAVAPGVERERSNLMNCSASQLRLIRPNFLNYQQLRQESFTLSDFDQPEEK